MQLFMKFVIFFLMNQCCLSIMVRTEVTSTQVASDQVTFYLYTKDYPQTYVLVDPNKVADLTDRLAKQKVVFCIHGWIGSRNTQWYGDLKDVLLDKYPDYALVEVDWKEPSRKLYSVSVLNTYAVAEIVANITMEINQKCGIPFDDVLLIGHSLGGQAVGFVGKIIEKVTGEKLPRIIALDPAGLGFSSRSEENRLSKNDANVVEVIHTNAGLSGFSDPCGTIDFYVNGGTYQPGCRPNLSANNTVLNCHHARAWIYFISALAHPRTFQAKKCDSWSDFEADRCDEAYPPVYLGDLNLTGRGIYYLRTTGTAPYAIELADDE